MELRNFVRVLRRGWLVIFALVVLGAAAGVGLTLMTTKTYQSTAKIFVASNSSANDTTSLQGGNAFTQDRTAAYIIFARSPAVVGATIQRLGLKLSQNQVAQKINASVEDNKVVIDIQVTDGDPQTAANIANVVSNQFLYAVRNFEQLQPTTNGVPVTPPSDTPGTALSTKSPDFSVSVVKLSVVYPANPGREPISPKPTLNIVLGVLIGLLLGLGIVILRDVLDNTMKGPADFEALGVPVLGTVPFDRRVSRSPLAFRSDPHSARSEAYRALRTNMQFVDVDNPPHVIVVTSAMPNEGKTTTAINLASALAEAGYRVCLVDADLRRPSVANTLGLVGDVGFTSVLISDTPVEDVLQNAGRNLAVLTSGPVPPNPSELLISEHARAVLADIAAKVDYCVIDTPPLLPVTDGAELATIADATLIVARAGKTTNDQSRRAIEALAKVGEKPVGIILNMVSAGAASDYRYGYYYTPYRPDRDSHAKDKDKDKGKKDVGPVEETTVVAADTADTTDADAAGPVVADAAAPDEAATPARSGLLN